MFSTKFILIILSLASLLVGGFVVVSLKQSNFVVVEIDSIPVLVEVADSPESRRQGLSGKEGLSPNSGMLFYFGDEGYHNIWMKGMLFPIDIVWIRNGLVVDIRENVSPEPPGTTAEKLPVLKPLAKSNYVLEVAAGFIKTHGINIGDSFKMHFGTDTPNQLSGIALNQASLSTGQEYFIDTLRKKPFRGSDFKIGKLLFSNSFYKKFSISYISEGFTISGVMNVPSARMPSFGFPVIILNHGLIHPSIYFSGRGSKREQDFFAKNGYVTIHPDYRGHADSSPNPYLHHDFYIGYTIDVINLVEALKKSKPAFMDIGRMGMWGHSMGGGIATRIMVLRPDIRAYVLFAPISADAKDNFFELPKKELGWLDLTYGTGSTTNAIYRMISPLTYFDKAVSPVQLHHGGDDLEVPILFSEKIYRTLKDLGYRVEFYRYPGQKHEFIEDWPLAVERALQFFDKYLKGAR